MTPQTPQDALSDADILDAAIEAGLWPNTVHSWLPAFHRYHAILDKRAAADRRLTAEQPAWRFERLDASKRIIATEPNGTEHILAKAELGSVAATTLFDRMAVALSARPSVTAEQPVAYTDPLYFRIKQRGGCFTATYEPDELFNFPLYTRAPVTAEQGGADAALKRIVTTYDAYRRRGVSPAPVEYSDVVQAIESGRASLTTQPQAEPAGWREALQWIASVNAMDHEYQAAARLALDQGRVTTPTEPT